MYHTASYHRSLILSGNFGNGLNSHLWNNPYEGQRSWGIYTPTLVSWGAPRQKYNSKNSFRKFLSHKDADTAAWSLPPHNDVGEAEWINVPEVSRPVHSSWKEFHKCDLLLHIISVLLLLLCPEASPNATHIYVNGLLRGHLLMLPVE